MSPPGYGSSPAVRAPSAAPSPGPTQVGPGDAHRSARSLDSGSATAELAMALPALLLLLFAGLAAVGAVTTKLQCVDAARDAALAAARGEPGTAAGQQAAPGGADVSVTVAGDTVTATVRAPVRLVGDWLWVDASAVAAVEPGTPGPAP